MKVTKEKIKTIMLMYYSGRKVIDIAYLMGLSRYTVDKYLKRYVRLYESEKSMTLKDILEKNPEKFNEIKFDYDQSPLDWFLHKYKTSVYFATKVFGYKKKSLQNK